MKAQLEHSMIAPTIRPFAEALYRNRNYQFWFFQVVGWTGYSIATFLTITLVDDVVSWPHIGHITFSALLGILVCWPLRPLYRATFERSIITSLERGDALQFSVQSRDLAMDSNSRGIS